MTVVDFDAILKTILVNRKLLDVHSRHVGGNLCLESHAAVQNRWMLEDEYERRFNEDEAWEEYEDSQMGRDEW
jgi:hypothetical protein